MERTHVINPTTARFSGGEPLHRTLCGRALAVDFDRTGEVIYSTPRTAKFASQVSCAKCKTIAAARGITFPEPQMVERRSARDGSKFMEREDVPFLCSPRSESYWSN